MTNTPQVTEEELPQGEFPMASIPRTPVPAAYGGTVTSPREQADWLLTKIKDSLDYVSALRARLQLRAGGIRVITLIFSGIVTIALGIRSENYSETLRNLAFVVGAISTTLGSLDLYFSYRGLWIEHEEAEWRLNRLRDRLQFYLEGRTDEQLDPATLAEFHESYQWIWDRLSISWLSLRRSSGK